MGIFDRFKKTTTLEESELSERMKKLSEHRGEAQKFAKQTLLDLTDWWGISRDEANKKMPQVFVLASGLDYQNLVNQGIISSEAVGRTFYSSRYNIIIFNDNEFEKRKDIGGWKASLAEEIEHSINENFGPFYQNQKTEFFGMLSKLYIAKKVQGSFPKDFRKTLDKATWFKDTKEKLEKNKLEVESEINKINKSNKVDKFGNLSKENVAKLNDLNLELQKINDYEEHILYHPAVAVFFQVNRMSKDERRELRASRAKADELIDKGIKETIVLRSIKNERDDRLNIAKSEGWPQMMQQSYEEISKMMPELDKIRSDASSRGYYTEDEEKRIKDLTSKTKIPFDSEYNQKLLNATKEESLEYSLKGFKDTGSFFEKAEESAARERAFEEEKGLEEELKEVEARGKEESLKEYSKINQLFETTNKELEKEKEIIGEVGAIAAVKEATEKQEEKKLEEEIEKEKTQKVSDVEEATVGTGAMTAAGAIDTKSYGTSIKDHIKTRIYGIPLGQQKNKAYSPIETKVSEPSSIEQAALATGAIAASAIKNSQEEMGFGTNKGEEYVYSADELSSDPVKESKKFVPFGSLLKDITGTFPRREKGLGGKTPISVLDRATVTIPRPGKETVTAEDVKLLKERMQYIVTGITDSLNDWWGISREEISDSVPEVDVITKEHPSYKDIPKVGFSREPGLENIIVINEDFAKTNPKGLLEHLYSYLGEEVGHSRYYSTTKTMGTGYSKFDSEFFGMLSRLHIAEELNVAKFHKEYTDFLRYSTNFSNEKEKIQILENEAKKYLESKDPKFVEKANEKLYEATLRRNHLYYYAAASFYFEARGLSSQQRFDLLKMRPLEIKRRLIEPQEIALNEMGKMTRDEIAEIVEKRFQRADLRQVNEESLKSYPKSAEFFQGVAKEAGKEEYGRGAQTTMEKQRDREMQIEMQGFANQLFFELAKFWGIPKKAVENRLRFRYIGDRIPPEIVLVDENNKKELVETKGFDPSLHVAYYLPRFNRIFLPKEYINKTGLYGWQSVLGEEVGHAVENAFGRDRPLRQREFFGMVSRLFIAEKAKGAFKEEYATALGNASQFMNSWKDLIEERNRMREEEAKMAPEERETFWKEGKGSIVKSGLEHIYQDPATALYFVIRRLAPEERFELLSMNYEDTFRNIIMEKGLEKIDELLGKQNTRYTRSNVPLVEKAYFKEISKIPSDQPESETALAIKGLLFEHPHLYSQGFQSSGQFFQRAAAEIGKALYGRIAGTINEEQEQTEQESILETGEVMEGYSQEEQYEEEYPQEQNQEEYQETGEIQEGYEQSQEEQAEEEPIPEEQVLQPTQINIEIPKKVTKKVAKKLESMGIKLPKKMIKK